MLHHAFTPLLWSLILLILLVTGLTYYRRYRLSKGCLPHGEACKKMATWYKNLKDGWSAPLDQSKKSPNLLDNTLYGEITYTGMKYLAKEVKFNSLDVFYDLGSGVGKLVIYLYLTTPIRKSVGVEMIGHRHQTAMQVFDQVAAAGLLSDKRQLCFGYDNLREANFEDATVIYMSSLCFPIDLMQVLSQRFLKMKSGLRIISSQILPEHPRFRLLKQGFLEMTWSSTSRIYYYELL
jgi:hypothetical protein